MKKIITFLIFIFVFSSQTILAGNNITITCPGSGSACTKSSNLPLIDEQNVYPGYTLSPAQVLTVINQDQADNCNLVLYGSNLTGSSPLAREINCTITSNGLTVYSGSLFNLINNNQSLGIVDRNSSRLYYWTVSLSRDLGNEYQNLSSVFDLNFNFSCGVFPTSTPTSAPSNNNGSSNGSSNNNSSSSSSSTTTTTNIVNTTVIAPARYRRVVALSDSDVLGAEATPTILPTETPVETPTPTPPVLGVTTEGECHIFWFPILYIIAFIINMFYLARQAEKPLPERSKIRYLLPPLLPTIAFLIDFFVLRRRCCLVATWYCQWFWIGNILAFLVPTWYFNRVKHKTE